MTTRAEIFDAIDRERSYQDQKWGTLVQHPHQLDEWIGIMARKLREARRAWAKEPSVNPAKAELLQVIAVGVAALEQHGVIER